MEPKRAPCALKMTLLLNERKKKRDLQGGGVEHVDLNAGGGGGGGACKDDLMAALVSAHGAGGLQGHGEGAAEFPRIVIDKGDDGLLRTLVGKDELGVQDHERAEALKRVDACGGEDGQAGHDIVRKELHTDEEPAIRHQGVGAIWSHAQRIQVAKKSVGRGEARRGLGGQAVRLGGVIGVLARQGADSGQAVKGGAPGVAAVPPYPVAIVAHLSRIEEAVAAEGQIQGGRACQRGQGDARIIRGGVRRGQKRPKRQGDHPWLWTEMAYI